ncbi:putative MFS-type transporter YcaD [Defluviimonas aquaemixtae]|uniref:Putative MFS-type transporter YcaD n=1 Tax=Albidovulum aquaemixtae TaxID=1542388 RepID=A0A2R8B3G7_9RHOB|nr:MFS transporter [Defluviimonas aquaemixtae]SPH17164.1 putative MFS-type transporter YcaD [Defluviimonas aquaemixtae]
MRLLISFAALFLSVILLQLGTGGVAPLDALSGVALGFSKAEIGTLGSAHFFGFFIGCWWAPRLMGAVGHSRAFAAFTAAGTIGLIAHMMIVDPVAWAFLRMGSGACVAGCYTIIEAWLQAKVTNETRGRAMGIYRVVDIGGSLGAQLVIGILSPAVYFSYNLLAILCCAALLPITVSRVEQPEMPDAPRLRPAMAWARSPLAAAGVVVSGITAAAFRMVGPIYGIEVGLSADMIALFLAAYVLGGAVAQIPLGWLADKFDRRHVLIGLSVAATLSCALTIGLAGLGTVSVFAGAAFFGAATMPIYSVSAAHAHDFAEASERVELSAALMFLYAVGAIASPLIASTLIAAFGASAMFVFLSLTHVALLAFSLLRMRARPVPEERTAYIYTPRTSFLVGRLLGRGRDAD